MTKPGEGGPVISGRQVRLETHPIVISEKNADGAPQVTLRREGDLIKEIHIRCACGEMIVLDCEYNAAPGPARTSPTPAAAYATHRS